MPLEVQKVDMVFGGLRALSSVNMKVPKGQLRALIGPNGSGKTTLLNVIRGFHKPTRGKVTFQDHDLTGKPPYEVANMGIVRTFHSSNLFRNMTVLDNVMVSRFPRSPSSVTATLLTLAWVTEREEEVKDRALRMLDFVGLTSRAAEKAGGLWAATPARGRTGARHGPECDTTR